jgi:hypothetical protein
MADFEQFKRLTLLYFAAASFSETSRRLGMADRAKGFGATTPSSTGDRAVQAAALGVAARTRARGAAESHRSRH